MTAPPAPGWPWHGSPFHAGEQAIQDRLGVRDRMEANGRRTMRDHMLEQHRTFFAQLPFLVLGTADAAGQPWASLLAGPPGFLASPDPATLRVNARPAPSDPVAEGVRLGAPVGLLGIEPHTRRRNRMNGRVVAVDAGGFTVGVEQSYGNCPQYIRPRHVCLAPAAASGGVTRSDGLDDPARAMIAGADTFFIASAYRSGNDEDAHREGVDVSHRGGAAGFVRVDGDVLTVPDFRGNLMFNTLGNLLLDPRAGLVFADFATGDLLHLTADAEIMWDGEVLRSFPGVERLLRLRVTSAVSVSGAVPLRDRGAGE